MKRGDNEGRSRSQKNVKIDMKQRGWQGGKWTKPAQYKDQGFVNLVLSFRVLYKVPGLHCLAECPTASTKAFCSMELQCVRKVAVHL
jgi:hypothetical protein